MEVAIPIPLDSDGFVRRACPACEREFKWLYADSKDEATKPNPHGYCCPYCAAWAQPDQWFTEAQVEYIQQIGLGVASDEASKIFSQFNRPGSGLKYTPGDRPSPPPDLPPEPDDMRRAEFACHPEDPLKVAEDWNEAVHCLICGSAV
jgi:hypothetical protein